MFELRPETKRNEVKVSKSPRRLLTRYPRLVLLGLVAAVAIAVVATVTVDLGPALRKHVERVGTELMGRPLHIGKLSIYLFRGQFLVEDFVVDGPTPEDRAFLTADEVVISMPWSALFRRELLFDSVAISDWAMVVESFPGDRHTFPDLSELALSEDTWFVTTLSEIHAERGQFTYEDHAAPWRIVGRDFDISVTKMLDYRGHAEFSGGTVQLQSFEPMQAALQADFQIDDGKVIFDRLDLLADGTESSLIGTADVMNWPEQFYQVRSELDLPILRDVFFPKEAFTLSGDGDFVGTFHLYDGGRNLRGEFSSERLGIDSNPFSEVHGSLEWRRDGFDIYESSAVFHDGTLELSYALTSEDEGGAGVASLEVTYADVDLTSLTDSLELEPLPLAGRAAGLNKMSWPRSSFADREGTGRIEVSPPDLITLQERRSPMGTIVNTSPSRNVLEGRLALGGVIEYSLGSGVIDVASGSHLATPHTFLSFEGQTAYGLDSRLPFHMTSSNLQESDRILAGLMTVFERPTQVVEIGGSGTFDGELTGDLIDPSVTGRFEAEPRAWDVMWGAWEGEATIENGYATVPKSILRKGFSQMLIDGRFTFDYPRTDGDEEFNGRFNAEQWPVLDLRTAFDQLEYPIEGLITGDFHLYGEYIAPFGFARPTVREVIAYGEPFESATALLRYEGGGVRLDGIEIRKREGLITGAAYVDWGGTYTFNADGRRIPVGLVAAVSMPELPLDGLLQFTAGGSGSFDWPIYDVQGRIDTLLIRGETIGPMTGRVGVRNEQASVELEVASPLMAVSASGQVAITLEADAELTIRFTDTSLDPFLRAFAPRFLPFADTTGSGALRVLGPLSNLAKLNVTASIEQLQLVLYDYEVRNNDLIQIILDQEVVQVSKMTLEGEDTELSVSGEVRLGEDRFGLLVTGDANLAILQGFFSDIRSAGNAEIVTEIRGLLEAPVLSGSLEITDGRLRHSSLPHSFEQVNGRVTFDNGNLRMDDLTATLGGGDVQFGGSISLDGYRLDEFSMLAIGDEIQLRYPEEFRSTVDANLVLQGPVENPVLSGAVEVNDARWVRTLETNAGLFDILNQDAAVAGAPTADAIAFPLNFDIRVNVPGTLRINDRNTRIVSSGELTLRGTPISPQLFGFMEIDRGEVFFEGNRYVVTRGSMDFTNPREINPFFDVEAETSVRVPDEIYRVVFHVAGTTDRFVPTLSSDPPLPSSDILSLLLGNVRDPAESELRAIRTADETEQQLLQARAAQLVTDQLSSGFGRILESSLGVDSFEITPSLSDAALRETASLRPAARLTIGKRVSDRIYATLSRTLTGVEQDLLILLEYDQSEQLSWVLSQNEDRTYALDFRVRHAF